MIELHGFATTLLLRAIRFDLNEVVGFLLQQFKAKPASQSPYPSSFNKRTIFTVYFDCFSICAFSFYGPKTLEGCLLVLPIKRIIDLQGHLRPAISHYPRSRKKIVAVANNVLYHTFHMTLNAMTLNAFPFLEKSAKK